MIYRNASNLGIKWSALYQEWPSDVDLIEKPFHILLMKIDLWPI